MYDFEADLGLLFQDAGVPVVIGATTTVGILNDRPAEAGGPRAGVLARDRAVLCPTPELPALSVGDALTVAGVNYTIRSWGPDEENRDGLLTRIWLKDAS